MILMFSLNGYKCYIEEKWCAFTGLYYINWRVSKTIIDEKTSELLNRLWKKCCWNKITLENFLYQETRHCDKFKYLTYNDLEYISIIVSYNACFKYSYDIFIETSIYKIIQHNWCYKIYFDSSILIWYGCNWQSNIDDMLRNLRNLSNLR